MVAPAKHNAGNITGTFGEPIRRTIGSTWTERELRALKRKARFSSVCRVIRSLIPQQALEQLIHETESEFVSRN